MYSRHEIIDFYVNGKIVNGSQKNNGYENRISLHDLRNVSHQSHLVAKEIYEELANYFQNEGQIIGQNDYAQLIVIIVLIYKFYCTPDT